jgi:hypothetical protein
MAGFFMPMGIDLGSGSQGFDHITTIATQQLLK